MPLLPTLVVSRETDYDLHSGEVRLWVNWKLEYGLTSLRRANIIIRRSFISHYSESNRMGHIWEVIGKREVKV